MQYNAAAMQLQAATAQRDYYRASMQNLSYVANIDITTATVEDYRSHNRSDIAAQSYMTESQYNEEDDEI
jgi:hypothetical protein